METQVENTLKSSHAVHQKRSHEFHHRPEKEVWLDPEPGEYCICQNCKSRVKNPWNSSCSSTQCPECGAYMISEWS